MHTAIALLLTLLLALASPSTASAQEEVLAPGSANGVPYLSGGIGDEEREAIEQARKRYNTKLVLAETSGSYVSNVSLTVATVLGEPILTLSGAGPLVLLQLPSGSYVVTADYDGRKAQKRFDVSDNAARTVIVAW
ncbi:MAG: hypothetical protein QM739_15835 [Propionivibrio sp.]